MAFSRDDIERLARLSRLSLTAEEIERFRTQLSQIVDYVAQIGEVDVGAAAQPESAPDRLVGRDDAVARFDREDELRAAAPESDNGFVSVKAVKE